MFNFISAVYLDFLAAKTIEQIGFISAVFGFAGIPGYLAGRLGYRSLASKLATAREEAHNLRDALNKEEEARRRAEDQLERASPSFWMRSAQRERESGNEELAVRALEQGYDALREPIGAIAVGLASHHLSLVLSADYADHLNASRRLATVAHYLMPEDADAAILLQDSLDDVLTPEETSRYEDFHGAEIRDAAIASKYVELIVGKADQLVAKDRPRIAVRLLRRAEFIARRAGLPAETHIGLAFSILNARIIHGDHEKVVEEASSLAARCTAMGDHAARSVAQALIARAAAEQRLDRKKDALETLAKAIKLMDSPALDDQTRATITIQAAVSLARAGNPAKAISSARQALKIGRDGSMDAIHRAGIFQNFGLVMVDCGLVKEAKEAVELLRNLEVESTYSPLMETTRRFLEWRCAVASNCIPEAIEIARDLLERYEAGHGENSGGAQKMLRFLETHA